MRCLALAQAWQDRGGEVLFVMCTKVSALESRLVSEGIRIVHLKVPPGSYEDAKETVTLALDSDSSWIVVDGYHFESEYQKIIKDSGVSLLCIDDNGHANHYYADIVLNQNLHANEGLYKKRAPLTKLLLGTRYVLLRREFWQWRGWRRTVPKVARKVLVTLGGSDPNNITKKIIDALCQLNFDGLEMIIVIGASNPNYEKIKDALTNSQNSFEIKTNVINMPELMAWADIAISSGGTTSWELAFMHLPNLIVILAENQVYVAEKLEAIGVALNLGWHYHLSCHMIQKEIIELLANAEVRVLMTSCSSQLVDGLGADRVIRAIQERTIHLKQACESDCELVFLWANDPEARKESFSANLITWEEHVQWFEKKIMDKKCIFFIAFNGQAQPIGQVRFEVDGQDAVISLSIDSNFRGSGLSCPIIARAAEKMFNRRIVSRINAFIKPHNVRSIKAFELAGFRVVGQEIIKGENALHYVRVYDQIFENNFEHSLS